MANLTLADFRVGEQNYNILRTGQVEIVVDFLRQNREIQARKIELLLSFLSQALRSQEAYAGKCSGVLTAELLTVANLDRESALREMNKPQFKHDPVLVDVILRLHNLVLTALNINIYNFSRHQTDIPNTGRIDRLINTIDGENDLNNKVNAILGCLLQLNHGKGLFAEKCASQLRAKLFRLARDNHATMQQFLQNDQIYKHKEPLVPLFKSLNCLAYQGPDIDLLHFTDGTNDVMDITKTGQVGRVSSYIQQYVTQPQQHIGDQLQAPHQAKVEAFLHCLSQAYTVSGHYQGILIDEFSRSLFVAVQQHQVASNAALNGYRFNDHEKMNAAVNKLIYLCAYDIHTIDMRNFPTSEGWVDILDTGRIKLVTAFITLQAGVGRERQRIEALLTCLSQTLSSDGKKRNECESVLKHDIFQLAQDHPQHIDSVMQIDKFKYDKALETTLKDMNYLGSIMQRKILPFNYPYRLVHHLYENYFQNKAWTVTYTIAGVSLLAFNGYATLISPTSTLTEKVAVAATAGNFIISPIGDAIYRAFNEER